MARVTSFRGYRINGEEFTREIDAKRALENKLGAIVDKLTDLGAEFGPKAKLHLWDKMKEHSTEIIDVLETFNALEEAIKERYEDD